MILKKISMSPGPSEHAVLKSQCWFAQGKCTPAECEPFKIRYLKIFCAFNYCYNRILKYENIGEVQITESCKILMLSVRLKLFVRFATLSRLLRPSLFHMPPFPSHWLVLPLFLALGGHWKYFSLIFAPQFAHSHSLNSFVPWKWKLIFSSWVYLPFGSSSQGFSPDCMYLRSPSADVHNTCLSNMQKQSALIRPVSWVTLFLLLSPASSCSLRGVSLFGAHLAIAIHLGTIYKSSISELWKHLGLALTPHKYCVGNRYPEPSLNFVS